MEGMMRVVGAGEMIITTDEYAELIQNQQELEYLVRTLLENAKLAWNKSHLSFVDEDVSMMLRVCEAFRYANKMRQLLGQEESDGTDKD